jgi:hypothetical protein
VSTFSESSCGIATSGAGAFLLVIGHASATSAERVGLGVSLTEGRSASALNSPNITIGYQILL